VKIILDHFAGIIEQVEHPVVVELGAHDGTHTALMVERLRGPFTYIAVEPDARARKTLKSRNLPVAVLSVAVGARDVAAAPFWLGTNTGSSSIRQPTGHLVKFPHIGFTESKVETCRLDTICRDLGRVDFIWADIQGAELDMIDGGAATLARTRYLYTEHEAGMYEGNVGLAGILERLPGWEVIEDYGYDALLVNNAAVPRS
jgi:FkbM family methyltransferase